MHALHVIITVRTPLTSGQGLVELPRVRRRLQRPREGIAGDRPPFGARVVVEVVGGNVGPA